MGRPADNAVSRVDPLKLTPRGPRADLGEYHDAYSFSPDGSAIAFGISAPNPGPSGPGRIGIRIVDTDRLEVTRDVATGVFAAALGWLEPRRVVAMLAAGFGCSPRPCVTILTADPVTGEVLVQRSLTVDEPGAHCDAAESPGRALVALVHRQLFIAGGDGAIQTIDLPEQFRRCGVLALTPRADRALVVSEDGGSVVEVELGSGRVEVRRLSRGGGRIVNAIALPRHQLVLTHRDEGAPTGVEVVDVERGRRRMIAPGAGAARVSHGAVLAYNGPLSGETTPIGVRAYEADGRRSFQVLRGDRILRLELARRFAYAIARRTVSVIDLRRGEVVSRSNRPFNTFNKDVLEPAE